MNLIERINKYNATKHVPKEYRDGLWKYVKERASKKGISKESMEFMDELNRKDWFRAIPSSERDYIGRNRDIVWEIKEWAKEHLLLPIGIPLLIVFSPIIIIYMSVSWLIEYIKTGKVWDFEYKKR